MNKVLIIVDVQPDIVTVNGRPQSKIGRHLIDNPRVKLVD